MGSDWPIRYMFSIREKVSRTLLACTVNITPSWPVFMAIRISSISPPRASPRIIRSGRIRRQSRTRSRMVIGATPSLSLRVTSATQSSSGGCNSGVSSTVTSRS